MPGLAVPTQKFYLLGEPESTAIDVDLSGANDLEGIQYAVAGIYAVVQPKGIEFHVDHEIITEPSSIIKSSKPVGIAVEGHIVREPDGPEGMPYVGNYLQVYPDHLGNHQRLFESYGPIIKTNNLGRVVYQTNDPEISLIAFQESDFFTKEITRDHPLFGVKVPSAGIFLGDTDTPEWRAAHKFLPPALGPKAVRHYSSTMQATVEDSFKVFDTLDERDEAFNVYQYMLKLGAQAVGKLTLGFDFHHFDDPDSPIHEMVALIANVLSLNKKVTSKGNWYAKLPFGDPKKLVDGRKRVEEMVEEAIANAARNGIEDLPLQEAALKASNIVDYAIRATDNNGEKLPKECLVWSLVVTTGAGFTTTSSLLSWLLYALCTYEGVQDRLLQELIDNGFDDNTVITSDLTDRLEYLNKFIKESQRMHNPSYQPGRTAKTDLILPGGYKIPKGSVVIPALHHIHNNPALWDNPDHFNPDRWDTPEVKNRHKGAYVPFAAGGRMCIGFNFALQEIKTFLPKLVYRYKFSREGDGVVQYDPMFQLIRPTNLYVRAERRVKWPPRSSLAETA